MDYLEKKLFNYDSDGNPVYSAVIVGLSSDSKPTTGLISGSKFIEADTGKTYVLDAISDSAAWTEEIVVTAASS